MTLGKLLIGWSRVDITPPRKTLLQGQFHARISDRVLSPLSATALALEMRGEEGLPQQAILLSCDLLTVYGFKADLLDQLAGRVNDFDLRKLTLNATHTHTAPPVVRGMYPEPAGDPDFMNPDEYRAWLVPRVADAVIEAWTARQPGAISRGFGYAVVGRCRRGVYVDGSARMYGRTNREDFLGFEACDDHAVNMLFTRSLAGELTGMVVNLACPAQCQEHLSSISADFWHDVRLGIAQGHGAGVHLLPQCAPAGDLSPHLLIDQSAEKDLRARLGLDAKGIIARRIVAAIDEGLKFAASSPEVVEFEHQVYHFNLPRVMVSQGQYELEKRIRRMSPEERKNLDFFDQREWPFGLICDLIARYEQQAQHPFHEVESHVIRLGDVALATNPFELFVEYGLRIRGRSRALQTFLVQLADDSSHSFYLPTQRALDGGHYSAIIKSIWVGPEGGDLLVNQSVAAINAFFPAKESPGSR